MFKKSDSATHWVPPTDFRKTSFPKKTRNRITPDQKVLPDINSRNFVNPKGEPRGNEPNRVDPIAEVDSPSRGKSIRGGKSMEKLEYNCAGNPRKNLNPDQLLSLVRNLSQEVADLKSGL